MIASRNVGLQDGSQTTYDQIGRKQQTSTLLSGTDYLDTTYEYDNNNRLKTLTMPGSYTQSYDYDDLGNMTQSTDTNGDDTDYSYDKNNRRITETQPNGLVTTWNYTDWKTQRVGNVLYERNTTSGDDIQTYYTYDSNGRATAIQRTCRLAPALAGLVHAG